VTDPAIDPATGRYVRRGRPTLLTPDTHDRIVQTVKAGNYLNTAAKFAGISVASLQSWMARGRIAAAQVEAHDPDGRYCPSCDADRTDEMAAIAAEQAQLNADLAPDDVAVGIVQGPCPECGSDAAPAVWELPDDELRYLSFLEAVTQAETVAEVAAVTHWRRAFTEDWRSARDYLARKRPEQWAAKTTIAISSEEAEQRIEAATTQALAALGVAPDLPGVDLGDEDPATVDDDGEPTEL
jgi:hypothetical protein